MTTRWPLKNYLYIALVLLFSIVGWWLVDKYLGRQPSIDSNQTNSNYQLVAGQVVSATNNDLVIQDQGLRYKFAGLDSADIIIVESDGTLIEIDQVDFKKIITSPHQIEVAYQMIQDKPTVSLIKIKLHSGLGVTINNIDNSSNQVNLSWMEETYSYNISSQQMVIDNDFKTVSTDQWSNIKNQSATLWWTWDWDNNTLQLRQIMINQ